MEAPFQIRPVRDDDRLPMAVVFALYRRFGFVEEGSRVKQERRASELDVVDMGLLL